MKRKNSPSAEISLESPPTLKCPPPAATAASLVHIDCAPLGWKTTSTTRQSSTGVDLELTRSSCHRAATARWWAVTVSIRLNTTICAMMGGISVPRHSSSSIPFLDWMNGWRGLCWMRRISRCGGVCYASSILSGLWIGAGANSSCKFIAMSHIPTGPRARSVF